jgi:hypothetical protein
MGRESMIARERNGIEPYLGRGAVTVNMNMSRLIRFMTEEVDAIATVAKDGRHKNPRFR